MTKRFPEGWRWLALGAALRLALFDSMSAGADEAKTLLVAGAGLGESLGLLRSVEASPPLYFLLMRAWTRLFSDPLLATRLFSVLCSLPALWLFYRLCRRLAPDSVPLAPALACLSSFWIHAAQDGRPYSLGLLLGLGLVHAALDLEERWSARAFAVYGSLALAAAWTHYFLAFLVVALAARAALRLRARPRRLAAWLAVSAAALLSLLPWELSSFEGQRRLTAALLHEPLTAAQAGLVLGTFLVDPSHLDILLGPWMRALGFAALGLTVLGLALLARRRGAREWLLPAVFLALPFAAARAAEAAFSTSLTQARYFLFFSPFFYIVLARACAALPRPWSGLARGGLLTAAAFGTAVFFSAKTLLDPRLDQISESLRRLPDHRPAIVHLNSYFYPAMRYHYLPERTHLLLSSDPADEAWASLPGYPALVSPEVLKARPPALVLDPGHLLSRRP